MDQYDAIVIGAGQAGPGVAGALADDGKRIALIEMERAGGTCLNHGCKPTKALRASASIAHQARRAAEFGVHTGEVTVDFGVAIRRVRSIIATMQDSLDDWIAGLDGLDYLHGRAMLRADPAGEKHEVTLGDRQLVAPEVYLNVGCRATMPPIPGLDSVPAMTEVELLALNELPGHLVIIGGGYIGCEFGQMFRRFGSEVTMITTSRIAPREYEDVSEIITDMLTADGVQLRTGRHDEGRPSW